MILNEILGIQKIKDKDTKVTTRQAVRAVVFKNNLILMVHTNKGDYKFPGGGIKRQENYKQALKREVTEETGYIIKEIGEKIGTIIQRNPNQFDPKGIFEMTSEYFLCDVQQYTTHQKLDKYEADQEFEPVWISLDDVIAINEGILTQRGSSINPWVYRETLVLKKLKECEINKK